MKNKEQNVYSLEYRMYSLVMYNISPIQQGIQAYHATIEYSIDNVDLDYEKWCREDKTVVILNGGTSTTMPFHFNALNEMGVKAASFREPDLNYSMSAISFLVDERVWNKKKYPEFKPVFSSDEIGSLEWNVWIESIGGEKIYQLREWLKQFRLA